MNILNRLATNNYKDKSFVKEWSVIIILVWMVKLCTMGVSIAAGWYYFNSIYITIIDFAEVCAMLAIISALLLELLSIYSVNKFWKFSIKKKKRTATAALLFMFIVFGLSFYTSTNGLANWASLSADNTQKIESKYYSQIDSVKTEYSKRKDIHLGIIESIRQNPYGWSNKRREYLTREQQNKINEHAFNVVAIDEAMTQELNELKRLNNNILTANNDQNEQIFTKFYIICATILLIQFCINGLLMFFWSKIHQEKQPETEPEIKKIPQYGLAECIFCGCEFEKQTYNQKYCSSEHREEYQKINN